MKKLTTRDFIERSKKIHGNKYDYSKSIFINTRTKLKIICPIHGDFEQMPSKHLSGKDCPKCGIKKMRSSKTQSQEQFIIKAKQINNNFYNYDKTKYKNSHSIITITCPKHGDFRVKAYYHLSGCGGTCPKCTLNKKTDDDKCFIEKSKKIHGETYDYSKIKYKKSHDKVTITCPKHGDFDMMAYAHVAGQGCPICSTSKEEKEVINFLKTFDVKLDLHNRNAINPYELDLYLPDKKIGIEFDGIYWHSELRGKDRNYHINKTKMCKKIGIQLLHIFENEWNDKREIVKSVIKSKLGLIENRIFARKCEIRDVGVKEKNEFLENNHLQGKCGSSVNLGLYHNNELVALLTFGKSRFNKKYDWEIIRYANKINTSVVGGFSRLLKHFRKHNEGSIITYADKRYSDGNLYKQNGFKELKDSAPNYFYFNNHKILYSRVKFQKHKLSKLLNKFDSNLTEWENMQNNGYNRIWDCGNSVWEFTS